MRLRDAEWREFFRGGIRSDAGCEMTTRQDVSSVPMQGGYVAKLCPVRAQNDALHPVEPLPPSPVLERRFERGRLFEADVVAELLLLHPDAIAIAGEDSGEVEAATCEAMDRPAST